MHYLMPQGFLLTSSASFSPESSSRMGVLWQTTTSKRVGLLSRCI